MAEKLNLILNPRKSGILKLNSNNALSTPLRGIPLVESYRYLGTVIDSSLSPTVHLANAELKVNSITSKLYPFRRHCNIKFNLNLF